MDSAAMLFCPPLPPLRLAADRAVVIGRHRSCDLPLRRANVSRRHAEVQPQGDGYVVRDLGSTNGTFVNGERIEGDRLLKPGDRIDISSCTVTFCHIHGDWEARGPEPGDEKTMLFERPPAREAFAGDLAEVPPFALLQMLEMGGKTGLLCIEGESVSGRIWLASGALAHAESEKREGVDAAIEIVNASAGQFRFEPQVPSPKQSIECSVTELLLEASRLLDEAR